MNNEKLYIIVDVRAEPIEFLNKDNIFVKDVAEAKLFDLNEGNEIIDAFNQIDQMTNSYAKDFLPGLMHIKNFKK